MPAKAISTSAQLQQPSTNKQTKYLLWTHKILPALILVACCLLALSIADKGLASAYYFKANHYLELWQRKPQTLDINSWHQAEDAIKTAVKYHPDHPHYLLTQAKINEWAWYNGFKTADQIAINDQLYQQAISLRPNWPNTYADYAYYLGIVNFRVSEAFDALKTANKYGPFIPETFQRTFSIATYHWPHLNGDQRAKGLYALEKMVKHSNTTYRQAVGDTKQYNLQRIFCLYLRLKKQEFPDSTQKRIEKDFCGGRH
ncbi:hypothetical protein [Rheinheimera tangshanensis]|uniref:Tetratricopeptide repeat protein n=1 Tax=Rheinheimera tangshanensis TaxID=400153 RepID=A0A5C8LYL4_9GAMM|nr:hypothetical protein [Rheinheimera tangshanensis]TXK80562.1 hypothetical protein FU839_11465 [Rheinheimera tangshanensis]GGM60286.1 hypothetical protein GCM10010920_21190 [Rheinheimera tangshanensis]